MQYWSTNWIKEMRVTPTMWTFTIFACLMASCKANEIFDSKLYHDVLDPDLCARQMETVDKYILYDSSFRVPVGLLDGNFHHLGNYYQCLAINEHFPGSNIEGKYCMIKANRSTTPTLIIPSLGVMSESNNLTWSEWKLNWSKDDMFKFQTFDDDIEVSSTNKSQPVIKSVSLSLAVCVPKSCSVDALLRPYAEHPLINFTYSEHFCRLPGDKPFHTIDYVIFSVFLLIGLMTAISTAYEVRHIFILKKERGEASELLCACSVYSNTARLLTPPDGPRALPCLDGIRAIAILDIMLSHTCLNLYRHSGDINMLDFAKSMYELKYLWILSPNNRVDTFFVLSGLLLVYTTAYKTKQKDLLNSLHWFYLHRYARLFPLLAGVVLLQVSLLHRLGDGPVWFYMIKEVKKCRTYWFSTLLHLQNVFNPNEVCVTPSWYLSTDMQLYVASPLVLYWVLGSARAAWTALTAAVLASLVAAIAVCFHFNFRSYWTPFFDDRFVQWYYQNPVTRSSPFFIGMLFGYVLHVSSGKKLYLPKWSVFLGHAQALMLSIYAVYILHPTMQPDWDDQPFLNVHNALFRSCWALALCWLIFACVGGYAGPVNWFLSLKLWRFPARISYAMYLYHTPVQIVLHASIVRPYYFSMYTVVVQYCSDLVCTVMLSVVVCVVIEEPFIRLVKLVRNWSNVKDILKKELD